MAKRKRERVQTHQGDEWDELQLLRSKYRAVINKIHDKKDRLVKPNSKKFNVIIDEVEKLYLQVRRPREQAADGEALLGLANSLATSVKLHSRGGGITPSHFVSCLLRDFGRSNGSNSIRWKQIGLHVSPIFMKAHGCNNMIGPLNKELKESKIRLYKKPTIPIVSDRPKELDNTRTVERTETDSNMLTMFEILKKKRRGTVVLENLILNRSSFAQTVENLFALSFLVRDGRVKITVDENGSHLVWPKNSPDAVLIASKLVNYNHFMFRFDFKDWKLMRDVVPVGEELMPHRSPPDPTKLSPPTRKSSRNPGVVKQEASVVQNFSKREYVKAMKLMPLVAVVSPDSK
ncbi:Nse4/EID family [Trema orientale]|uniref:Non-structural maintenance of chromosomes element 4 n=1 Tax=Trema orientale TaxID=63057 RepID=A0A2P5FCF5_TREOI|nr:Nse4/EID family [Trema orientale]